MCPITGHPDFASITVRYVADRICVELKSLKMYVWSFRNEGGFHEALTNRILDDLVAVCSPQRMAVTLDYLPRGGIKTVVTAEYPSR